jgi:hypothetical protein
VRVAGAPLPTDLTDRQWGLIEPLLPEPLAGPASRRRSTGKVRGRRTPTLRPGPHEARKRLRAALVASLLAPRAAAYPGPSVSTSSAFLSPSLYRRPLDEYGRVRIAPCASSRAGGYQRLLDYGLTIKGVAEQLSTTRSRVREHLRILKLPDPVQAKIAAGDVPLRAVKPLAELAKIHAGLAEQAVQEILEPDDQYEPYSWADLERSPLEVAIHRGELPDGAYSAHTNYPLDRFELTEQARKDLQAIEKPGGEPITDVWFRSEEIEQAKALGAAHGENWQTIIVGTDVASQLVCDQLARRLKDHGARARRVQQPVDEIDRRDLPLLSGLVVRAHRAAASLK